MGLGHQLRRVVGVNVVRRFHPHRQLRVTLVRFSSTQHRLQTETQNAMGTVRSSVNQDVSMPAC